MPTTVRYRFTANCTTSCPRPIFLERIPAGFPSPASDYEEGPLDLNTYLIKRPAATFFVRVTGDSMIKAGIHSGDLLIVDRSLEPADGNVVVAILDGELTVKRLHRRNGQARLDPENDDYDPIQILPEQAFEIWGIVTHVIHPV